MLQALPLPASEASSAGAAMECLLQASSGAAVSSLQSRLIGLGFLAGAADGDFAPATALALRDLRRRLLLRPDGVFGPRTDAALAARGQSSEAHPAVRPRSGEPAVPSGAATFCAASGQQRFRGGDGADQRFQPTASPICSSVCVIPLSPICRPGCGASPAPPGSCCMAARGSGNRLATNPIGSSAIPITRGPSWSVPMECCWVTRRRRTCRTYTIRYVMMGVAL